MTMRTVGDSKGKVNGLLAETGAWRDDESSLEIMGWEMIESSLAARDQRFSWASITKIIFMCLAWVSIHMIEGKLAKLGKAHDMF